MGGEAGATESARTAAACTGRMPSPPSPSELAPARQVLHELSLPHLARRPVIPPPEGARAPLLLLLHGLGSTEHMLFTARHHCAPEFAVVAPRGRVAVGDQLDSFTGERFGARARGWFHMRDLPGGGRAPNPDEAREAWEHVTRFAQEATEAYDADPARVLVAGFSQGAMTALAALLTAPEIFAGAASLGGRLLPEVVPRLAAPERLAGRTVLIAHATGDPRVPLDEARQAREQLAALPLVLTYEEVPAHVHGVTSTMRRALAAWAAEAAGVADREARAVTESAAAM